MTEQLNGNIANLEELEAFVAKVNNPAIYIQDVRNTEKLGRPYHLRSLKKGQELDKEEVEEAKPDFLDLVSYDGLDKISFALSVRRMSSPRTDIFWLCTSCTDSSGKWARILLTVCFCSVSPMSFRVNKSALDLIMLCVCS